MSHPLPLPTVSSSPLLPISSLPPTPRNLQPEAQKIPHTPDTLSMAAERGMLAASSAEAAVKGERPSARNASSPFSWNEDGVLSLASSGCNRNVGFAAFVQSTVDEPALRKSFESLVDRHSQLRTAFVTPVADTKGSEGVAQADGSPSGVALGVAAAAAAAAVATTSAAAAPGSAGASAVAPARVTVPASDVKLDFDIVHGAEKQVQEARRALVEPFDLAAPVRAGTSLLRVRLISAQDAPAQGSQSAPTPLSSSTNRGRRASRP